MSDLSITTERFGSGDDTWQHDPTRVHKIGCTLDLAKFVAVPGLIENGAVRSGIALGRVTATGLFAPYNGATDEVQLVTPGGSGLTSFTLTLSGQTTASIAAGATDAVVQAAIEALSNVGEGNVSVTGNPGGPWTVAFINDLADTDVAQMTSTPAGGTGTVTVTTTTAGGAAGASDGTQVFRGFLTADIPLRGGKVSGNLGASRIVGGVIRTDRLPIKSGPGAIDAAAITTHTGLTSLIFTEGV